MMSEAEPTTSPEEPPEVEDLQTQAVVVRIGPAEFGLHVDQVHEVLHVPRITRLPFPPPSVPGVVSVRGAVLPVLDLGDRLFGTPSDRAGRLVIVTDPGSRQELALLVDAVVDLIPATSRVPDPPSEVTGSLPDGWIGGVLAPSEDRLITLLKLELVLARNDEPDEEAR